VVDVKVAMSSSLIASAAIWSPSSPPSHSSLECAAWYAQPASPVSLARILFTTAFHMSLA
jgi:hypothetical protein